MSLRKIVVCGAGFLGRHIAKEIATANIASVPPRSVQVSSRKPEKIRIVLASDATIPKDRLLPAVAADVTKPATLRPAFEGATTIVSLVGIMHGSPQDFENIQWKGAENVALCAKEAGAKLVHFSAIGADPESRIPYVRTKGLAEQSILGIIPDATIIRPSLVFGPEDDFFNRFARLAHIMPFMPVFGGGKSRFQPVYVGDLARLVEMISRGDPNIENATAGKIVEAGGPQVFTYHELMQLVLKYTDRSRPILSLPFVLGTLQGAVLEKLPVNLFTVTRAQVEQLKSDNVVAPYEKMPKKHVSLEEVITKYSETPLRSVQEILPTYLC